ncbi:RbAp48 related family member (rba-1) [Reticulomyxa filosa]|uniref:RbAp48 related family member (Rba-1) n=1 Tax=Reticulomyxa filosa TaxID=46433 RepID=X6NHG0_RETFI|nr:RbAp48 related family member (rba-1) [Reticulomyxa filosa]|eukprot:ETO25396.1 RbAp48 related family member (rba-1) [Reticulomyxa filosa]
MKQAPHLIATRTDQKDIALYRLNYLFRNAVSADTGASAKEYACACGVVEHWKNENESTLEPPCKRAKIVTDYTSTHARRATYMQRLNVSWTENCIGECYSDHTINPSLQMKTKTDRSGNRGCGSMLGMLSGNPQFQKINKTGVGLQWNEVNAGILLAGNAMDILSNGTLKNLLKPLSKKVKTRLKMTTTMNFISMMSNDPCNVYKLNENASKRSVTNIEWLKDSSDIFATVSSGSDLNLWDRRSNTKGPIRSVISSSESKELLGLSWNPQLKHLIAAGGYDGELRIWDIRKLLKPMDTYKAHKSRLYHCQWCPYYPSVIASCGQDKLVNLYDIRHPSAYSNSRPDPSLTPNYLALFFTHMGHCAPVTELDWCPKYQNFTIASTDLDGVVQVWTPIAGIVNPLPLLASVHSRAPVDMLCPQNNGATPNLNVPSGSHPLFSSPLNATTTVSKERDSKVQMSSDPLSMSTPTTTSVNDHMKLPFSVDGFECHSSSLGMSNCSSPSDSLQMIEASGVSLPCSSTNSERINLSFSTPQTSTDTPGHTWTLFGNTNTDSNSRASSNDASIFHPNLITPQHERQPPNMSTPFLPHHLSSSNNVNTPVLKTPQYRDDNHLNAQSL